MGIARVPFKPGQPKPAGSGRKPGQTNSRPRNRFCELLDGDGFSLKKEVRAAVCAKDPEWVKALAQLLRAIDTGASTTEPQLGVVPDEVPEDVLRQLAGSTAPA